MIYERFQAKPATVSPWSLEDTYRAKPTWTSRPVLRGYFSVRGACWIRGRPRARRRQKRPVRCAASRQRRPRRITATRAIFHSETVRICASTRSPSGTSTIRALATARAVVFVDWQRARIRRERSGQCRFRRGLVSSAGSILRGRPTT